jgi:hypothetical protein
MVSRMEAASTPSIPVLSRTEALRAVVASGVAALGAIGLLLVMRRAAGAVTAELGAWSLAASLALAASVVFGGRVAWRQLGATRMDRVLAWCGSAALVLFCLGCAWPDTTSFWWSLWLPAVVADQFSRGAFLESRARTAGASPAARVDTAHVRRGVCPRGRDELAIVQSVERVRDARGVESIRGMLRAEFAAGQRHATLYVGFCPPLERLPVVEVEVVDGTDASAKVVQALAHGVQLELRLAEPAEEACSAAVEICATPSPTVP